MSTTDNKKFQDYYLLVFLDKFDEDSVQKLLEIALDCEVIPYSCKEEKNSFIFGSSSEDALINFKDKISTLSVTIKEYSR